MDTLNIIFGFATIIGTAFGLISYLDAKKSKEQIKIYNYLFDIADKNIDKNTKQKDLDELIAQHSMMEKAIKEDVPIEARKAVLFDRLKAEESQLMDTYSQYLETKVQFEDLQKIPTNIPDDILKELEDQIKPDYILKEEKRKYQSMLTTISYITAFISVIPVINILSRFSIILSVYPLFKLITLNLPKDKQKRKEYIRNIAINSFLIISSAISIFFFVMFVNDIHYYFSYYRLSNEDWLIGLSISVFFLLLSFILKIIIIKKPKHNKKK